jgi:hypothetical protein
MINSSCEGTVPKGGCYTANSWPFTFWARMWPAYLKLQTNFEMICRSKNEAISGWLGANLTRGEI